MFPRRRVRSTFSGKLEDPRQLTFELSLSAAAGVCSHAVLPPAISVAVPHIRHYDVRRSRVRRSDRLTMWPVYWVPLRAQSPMGDAHHV